MGRAIAAKQKLLAVQCVRVLWLREMKKNSTRARANILREFLTLSPKKNPFDHSEIYDIMDLCVSCKGCKSECPSSVDMARYKAEFLQHWWDKHGIPLRTRAVAYISSLNRIGMLFPVIT